MVIKIKLRPSYIKSGQKLKEFQNKIIDFGKSDKEVAILNAPTGAGKTYAFKEIELNGFILLLLPNNLLSNEVYNNFSSDTNVGLINSSSLNEYILNKKNEGFYNITKDRAINYIANGKKVIISNPEIFYYIILNKYKNGGHGDSLTDFIINGLKMVIIDEVHIYTRDQTKILFSILKLLNKNIKKLFSSATIPESTKELIYKLFDKNSIEFIDVEREYKRSNDNIILQGPVSVLIPDESETSEYIKNNAENMKSGYWFIICDSIRNIDKVNNQLIKSGIKSGDIEIISAYHDPEYTGYKKIYDNGARIIIGSNIIEQGINPPMKYNNFIIEPGMDIKNFIQRFGRIGRNREEESNAIIVFKSEIGKSKLYENIDNFGNFIEEIEKKLPEKDDILKAEYIGVYAALISDNFSFDLSRLIKENILSEEAGTEFSKWFFRTKITLSKLKDLQKDRKLFNNIRSKIRDLKNIMDWWNEYYNSIMEFIPDSIKVEGIDITDKHRFSYDYIWIRKNKNIVENKDCLLIVSDFKEKSYYDFDVSVEGIPFEKFKLPYKDVSPYKARSLILKRLKDEFDSYYDLDGNAKALIEGLKDIVYATADYERLFLGIDPDD